MLPTYQKNLVHLSSKRLIAKSAKEQGYDFQVKKVFYT